MPSYGSFTLFSGNKSESIKDEPDENVPNPEDSAKSHLKISNPQLLSTLNTNNHPFFKTFQPPPPLPDPNTHLDHETRWQNFHRKRDLAETLMQHTNEPPLGRHLRFGVRSVLHLAEVSPEAIALDQSMESWEFWPLRSRKSSMASNGEGILSNGKPALKHHNGSYGLRNKFRHKHSKSVSSVNSSSSFRSSRGEDSYSNQGSVLISGESSIRLKREKDNTKSISLRQTALNNLQDSSDALRLSKLFSAPTSPTEMLSSPVSPDLSQIEIESPKIDMSPKILRRATNKLPDPSRHKSMVEPLRRGTRPTTPPVIMDFNNSDNQKAGAEPKLPQVAGLKQAQSSTSFDVDLEKGQPSTPTPTPNLQKQRSVKFESIPPTPKSASNITRPALDRQYFNAEYSHDWFIPNYGRIKFTDHAPMVFRTIRQLFGYSLFELDSALSLPFSSVSTTAGKSEAIFFLTHNNARFMFKTLRGSEPENLKAFLPDYLNHIRRNPNTLLPRYLGMYTFEKTPMTSTQSTSNTMNSSPFDPANENSANVGGTFPLGQQYSLPANDDAFPQKLILVIMANVFDSPYTIHERYDFKGSNVGRRTLSISNPHTTMENNEETEEDKEKIGNLTLKEMDFQYRVFNGLTNLIHVGPDIKHEIIHQLQEDVALLRKFEFMDYSLLIGIHRADKKLQSGKGRSRLNSVASTFNATGADPNANVTPDTAKLSSSLRAQSGIIQPLLNSASNFISSIMPSPQSPLPKEPLILNGDYFSSDPNDNLPSTSNTPIMDEPLSFNESVWAQGIPSVKLANQEIYFVGLIDVLQKFTLVKWIERGLKGANARLLGTPTTPIFGPPTSSMNSDTPSKPSSRNKNRPNSDPINEANVDQAIEEQAGNGSPSISIPGRDQSTSTQEIMSPTSQSLPDPSVHITKLGHSASAANPPKPKPKTRPTRSNTTAAELKEPPPSFIFGTNQYEISVEEPNRYADRLVEYIKGIVV